MTTKVPGRGPSKRARRAAATVFAPARESEAFMARVRSAQRRGRCLRCDRPGDLFCPDHRIAS